MSFRSTGRVDGKQKGLLLYGRGASYEILGAPDRARADLDAAVALLPGFANVYLYQGIVWGKCANMIARCRIS
jgi:lipoprotein NlpI